MRLTEDDGFDDYLDDEVIEKPSRRSNKNTEDEDIYDTQKRQSKP